MFYSLIDSGFFSLLFPFLLLLFLLTGYHLAKRREKKTGKAAKSSGVENAVIGFFALLLSFTLVSAGSSYKDRLGMIHQQASCLAQMYRGSLDKPDSVRKPVTLFLLKHIEIQIENRKLNENVNDKMLDQIGLNNQNFLTDMKQKNQLQHMLPAFNALSSETYKLIYSYDERIPKVVMFLLVAASLLIGILIGFLSRLNHDSYYLASIIYLVIVSLTMQAIRDLDNPNTGSVKPSYENLSSVKSMILQGE